MRKTLILFFVTTLTFYSQSKPDTFKAYQTSLKLDSLTNICNELQKEVTSSKKLLEMMEKTNQQIGLWSNPYGVFISALGVLFTLMTFFFAGFFYLQSKEYREKINSLIQSHQTALNKLIDDWTIRKTQIDKQIEENQSKILKTTDKQKLEELGRVVEKLKIERESINFPLGLNYGTLPISGNIITGKGSYGNSGYNWGFDRSNNDQVKCVSCNSIFPRPISPQIVTGDGKWYVKCPYCSADNQY